MYNCTNIKRKQGVARSQNFDMEVHYKWVDFLNALHQVRNRIKTESSREKFGIIKEIYKFFALKLTEISPEVPTDKSRKLGIPYFEILEKFRRVGAFTLESFSFFSAITLSLIHY